MTLSAIFFWRKQNSTQAVDTMDAIPAPSPTQVHVFTTEVKTVEDSPTPSPTSSPSLVMTPLPAVYYSPYQQQDSMIDDFFGRTARSRDSQAFPPPYSSSAASEGLPAYPGHPKDDIPTLARFMFIYGFFFPPFWFMGIAILLTPLKPTPEWEMGKSEEEKTALLKRLRDEELKWAKRCLWASLTLLASVALLGVIVYQTVLRK